MARPGRLDSIQNSTSILRVLHAGALVSSVHGLTPYFVKRSIACIVIYAEHTSRLSLIVCCSKPSEHFLTTRGDIRGYTSRASQFSQIHGSATKVSPLSSTSTETMKTLEAMSIALHLEALNDKKDRLNLGRSVIMIPDPSKMKHADISESMNERKKVAKFPSNMKALIVDISTLRSQNFLNLDQEYLHLDGTRTHNLQSRNLTPYH